MADALRTATFLAFRRLRDRPGDAVLTGTAVGLASLLVGAVALVGSGARDHAALAALRAAGPAATSTKVHVREDPGGAGSRLVRGVLALMAPLRDLTDPPVTLEVWGPFAPADERGIRIVRSPHAAPRLLAGRLPRGCDARRCEVVSLARVQTGEVVRAGRLRLVAVGRGVLGAAVRPSPEVLHGRAVWAPPAAPLERLSAGRPHFTVIAAPLRPRAVVGAGVGDAAARLGRQVTRIDRVGDTPETSSAVRVASPASRLAAIDRHGRVAQRRLLLIAAQGAALVIAFAAFLAATRRRDAELLRHQLAAFGASRRLVETVRFIEGVVPALAAGAAAALLLVVAGLASGRSVGADALSAIGALALAGGAVVTAATRPGRRRGPGALDAAAVTALAVVAWQASASGGLDAHRLAEDPAAAPLILLLPLLVLFAGAVILLRLLPLLFRLAERMARRARPAARLALVATVRRPAATAAATSFLAVALGAALFCLNYRGSLLGQRDDAAAFRAGAAWRVREPGGVAPLTRFRAVTAEPPAPLIRLEATDSGGAGVALLGIPAARLRSMPGWRDGFSALDRGRLAAALTRPPIRLTGPRADRRARRVRVWLRTSAPQRATLHFLTAGQAFAAVPLGLTADHWQRAEAPLPPRARGAVVAGLTFSGLDRPTSALFVRAGALEERVAGRWRTLSDLGDWRSNQPSFFGPAARPNLVSFPRGPVRRAIELVFERAAVPLLRPGYAVPEAVPALVGSGLAPAAVDGRITVRALGLLVNLRVAAVADYFPTVVRAPHRFAVLDYDALFAALNSLAPSTVGAGEALFAGRPPPGLRARLAAAGLRHARVTTLEGLEAAAAEDPIARSAAALLLATAILAAALGAAGLALAAVALARDERREMAEYEAMGVAPGAIGTALTLRLLLMAAAGVVAAVAGAAAAVALVDALVALTAGVSDPVPPIEPRPAWAGGAALLLAWAAAVAASARAVAARATAVPAGARLR